MGGSSQPKNLHGWKCSASFPTSDTPCLWGDVHRFLWSKIIVHRQWSTRGRQHKCGTPYASLEHNCALFPAEQPWGCLLPIPACRSSLPDWTVLISCQLDWLRIFIICNDWANLDSSLNQGRWRTAAGRDFSSLQEVYPSLRSMQWFHVTCKWGPRLSAQTPSNIRSLHVHACWTSRKSRVWKKSTLPPSTMPYHKSDFDCLAFGGKFSLSCAFHSWPIRAFGVRFCYWRCWGLWRKQL